MPQLDQTLQINQIRTLLRQKYPDAHRHPSPGHLSPVASHADGSSPAEALTLATLEGQFTEITGGESAEACPGMSLVLHHLLEQTSAAGRGVVLVDGAGRFDPQSYPASLCRNLFWARCDGVARNANATTMGTATTTQTALKVADLFLRDGNLPLVILDLFHLPGRDMTRVPLSAWYRLRQGTEQTGSGLCLLAARSTGPAAHRRLALGSSFNLDALDVPRTSLLPQLRLRLERAQARHHGLPLTALDPARRIA